MQNKFLTLVNKTIYFAFLILAVATPLIFTTFNTELFEVPKMHFVYFISVLLFFLTLTKFILIGKIIIPKSFVFTIFAIFVAIQVISTLFSIDKFTSIFGYPSRLNGSLISQFAYLIILSTALINLNFEKIKKVLIAVVISAFAVSLWGIPAHFGKDPSCLVLTGELTSTCWKSDFNPTLRIFSTLGQPNWLASYLVIVLPISLVLLLSFKQTQPRIFFFIASIVIFWAIILTNSRSGVLGLGVSLIILAILLGINNIRKNLKSFLPLAAIFIIITLTFSTDLKIRIQETISNGKLPTTSNSLSTPAQKPTQTALAAGGTESGQIRLVVWQGALDIFKNWPVLGSGPETFVSSYFMFRPSAHNQTSEWEFFYNKAHNEFLNYLSNTGAVGFVGYLLFLVSSFVYILKIHKKSNIAKAIFAAIAGYLTTIFFGFSTVATQVILFLLVSSALIISKNQQRSEIKLNLKENFKFPAVLIITLVGLFVLSFVFRTYISNVFEKRAGSLRNKSIEKGLIAYTNAARAHPANNPYLLANYSSSVALAATSAEESQKSELIIRANQIAQKALQISPNNFLIAQRVARTYALLAGINENFSDQAKNITKQLIKLAPNYPVTYLTNAKIFIILEENESAISSLEKTLELKPDYLEARQLLDQVTLESLQ